MCSKVTRVKSIYILNVAVKQEILVKTQKTKQATSCREGASHLLADLPNTVHYYIAYATTELPTLSSVACSQQISQRFRRVWHCPQLNFAVTTT